MLAPLVADHPCMRGWRFVDLVPASTGIDACFRRGPEPEVRVRFARPGVGPTWCRWSGLELVGWIADAEGRLPESGPPLEFLATWLRRGVGEIPAVWPRWDPDPPVMVVASGIPRAGTGWVKRIARSLIEGTGHFLGDPGCTVDALLDRPGSFAEHEAVAAAVCDEHRREAKRVRLVKAHYFTGCTLSPHPAVRVLFVYRDLRDVVVSQLDRVLHMPSGGYFSGLSPDEAFVRVAELTLPVAAAALDRLAVGAPQTTRLLRYEHLLADLGTETRRIARFLGIDLPEEFLEPLVEAHRFRQEAGRAPGREQPGAYHRRGVAGGWREQLTSRQLALVARFVPDIEGLLARIDERLGAQHV